MTLKVEQVYPTFHDVDGQPVDDGYIYVGTHGLNPEVSPINVYWDENLTIPAAQPIRTINGYPSQSGTPGELFIAGVQYSITVRNKNGSLIHSDLTKQDKTNGVQVVSNKAAAVAIQPTTTRNLFVRGDDGGEFYGVTGAAPGTYSDDGGSYCGSVFIPTGGDGSSAWVRTEENVPYNVIWFGATGDGSTDDTTSIQNAIDATPEGGSLYIPSNEYSCSGVIIEKPIRIYGDTITSIPAAGDLALSHGGTVLKARAGGENYVLTIRKAAAGSPDNWENNMYGVVVEDIALDGADRTIDMGGMYLSELDHSAFRNMEIQRFSREAINFYQDVRECDFITVRTRWCGNKNTAGTSYPAINMTDNATSGDAHNAIRFSNCQFIFSLGDTFLIQNTVPSSFAVRQIYFNSCFFHGILASQDGGLYAFTADQKTCSHLKINGGREIFIVQCDLHQTGDGVPAIDLTTSANYSPQVWLSNSRIDSHYGATTPQYGIHVQTGELTVDMTQFRNHISGSVRVESGGTIHYGFGNVLDIGAAAPSYDASATVTQNLYSNVNFNNHILSAIAEAQTRILTSRNDAESILIQSQIDNSGTAMNFQTKNGAGTQSSKMYISSGGPGQPIMLKPIGLMVYTDATRPAANYYQIGSMIWNSDDNAPNVCDGTNWRDMSGAIT